MFRIYSYSINIKNAIRRASKVGEAPMAAPLMAEWLYGIPLKNNTSDLASIPCAHY